MLSPFSQQLLIELLFYARLWFLPLEFIGLWGGAGHYMTNCVRKYSAGEWRTDWSGKQDFHTVVLLEQNSEG